MRGSAFVWVTAAALFWPATMAHTGAPVPAENSQVSDMAVRRMGQDPVMDCRAMMAQRQQMMAEQRAADERLKELVAQMNRMTGPEKVEAMEVVINAMVDQRIAQRERMQQMQERMMAHMMGHMQGGQTGGMQDGKPVDSPGTMAQGGMRGMMACPMMKEMMGGPGGMGMPGEPGKASPSAPNTGPEGDDHAQHH